MKRTDSFGAALFTVALLVVGALCALPAVAALRGLGWDVSGSGGLTKLGVALWLFLGCLLICAAFRRVVLWVRVRRVRRVRRLNRIVRQYFYDDREYADYRDLPRFWRRDVRLEARRSGGRSRGAD